MKVDLTHWEQRLERFVVAQSFADSAHDLGHIRRVVFQAKRLAKEEGAELEIVLPAAWLHDCVSVSKEKPNRRLASSLAARAASDWLRVESYPPDLIPAIAHAIEAHSFSAQMEPRTIEAAVVQDADRLDALGAVGIARTFLVAGAMGSALAHEAEPDPSDRTPDDRLYAVDHFYTKLLSLELTMRTESGRVEAHRRTKFIRTYLDELVNELESSNPLAPINRSVEHERAPRPAPKG